MEELKSLLERTLGGDIEAFGQVVSRFQDMAVGCAYAILGDFHAAEDAAQNAFITAYQTLGSLRELDRFPGWFRQVVLGACHEMTRRKQPEFTPLEEALEIPSGQPNPEKTVETTEIRGKVLDAVRSLSEPNRLATTLFYINGYSVEEVSNFLEVPEGTVKRRLHDSRRQLRKELITMVESELKQSRPDRRFTESVVQKVGQIRVWPSGRKAKPLLLTDSERRSFVIVVGSVEAQAIQPWLSGDGSPDDLDIHTVLVRTLHQFGRQIKEVTISELKANVFYATLSIQLGKSVLDVDCRPSDALNFAVRADAPILVDKEVADQCILKRKDGQPLSPVGAWRDIRQYMTQVFRGPRPFRNASELIRALEKDPESIIARQAVWEVVPRTFKMMPPKLKDTTDAIAEVEAWVERCRDSKLEGAAAGLLGAAYLSDPTQEPKKAIPHLEKAHRLQPKDRRVGFDLATAYAMAGRNDEAFSVIQKSDLKHKRVRECGNFSNLWDDPRFQSIVGEPDIKSKDIFVSGQLYMTTGQPPLRMVVAKPSLSGGLKKTGKISQSRTREPAQWLDCGHLVRVENASRPPHEAKNKQWLILDIEGNRAAAIRFTASDLSMIDSALAETSMPRPMTRHTFCNIVRAAQINIDAVIMVKRTRAGIEAALVTSDGERREPITVAGPAALSTAFTSKCPVLITESLAEKLYVRGKTGRPLSARTATQRLLAN